MAKFPIQYAEILPSGKSSQVRMDADVSAGFGAIARGGMQVGSAMMDYAESVEKMESEAELVELRSRANELETAAFKTLMNEQDPDVRTKVYDKARSDIQSLAGKYKQTNRALDEFKASAISNMDNKFNGLDFSMRQRRAKSTMDIAGIKALESGNLEEYKRIVNSGLQTSVYTPEEAKYLSDNAENNSVFAQARILMATKPVVAKQALEAMKGLDGEQLDKRDQLIRIAEDNMRLKSDDAVRNVVVEMDKAKASTLAERAAMAPALKTAIVQGGVTGTQTRVMFDEIDKWANGEDATKNPVTAAYFQTRATDLWRGSITKSKYIEELNASLGKGELNYEEYAAALKEADTEIKASQAQTLTQIEQDTLRIMVDAKDDTTLFALMQGMNEKDKKSTLAKRQIQFANYSQYNKAVRQWLSENPDATGREIYIASQELLVPFLSRKQEEITGMMGGGDFDLRPIGSAQVTIDPNLPLVHSDSDAEYNALPSGTRFQDEFGKVWTKP